MEQCNNVIVDFNEIRVLQLQFNPPPPLHDAFFFSKKKNSINDTRQYTMQLKREEILLYYEKERNE
jgi:hypothetical protein